MEPIPTCGVRAGLLIIGPTRNGLHMIRRKRRIRIALSDLWDGTKDFFTSHTSDWDSEEAHASSRAIGEFYLRQAEARKLAAERQGAYMTRRKRRIRIALSDLWDAVDPRKRVRTSNDWDSEEAHQLALAWGEHHRKLGRPAGDADEIANRARKQGAHKSAGYGQPGQPGGNQPSVNVRPPTPGGPDGYPIPQENDS